jgi:hypothetical protein
MFLKMCLKSYYRYLDYELVFVLCGIIQYMEACIWTLLTKIQLDNNCHITLVTIVQQHFKSIKTEKMYYVNG